MTRSTLVLRLEGPMQAWGAPGSYWEDRPTLPRPTKSAVVGLVASALGRNYDDPISDLGALRFSVRADRPGHMLTDKQTAGGGEFPLDLLTRYRDPDLRSTPGKFRYGAPCEPAPDYRTGELKASWASDERATVIRDKGYLTDAAFLAALTGDSTLITDIASALDAPQRPVFLGRLCCPPTHPLRHALLDGDHHEDWADLLPLLDGATTTTPTVWIESSHGPISYEQPGPTVRNWLPLHLQTLTKANQE